MNYSLASFRLASTFQMASARSAICTTAVVVGLSIIVSQAAIAQEAVKQADADRQAYHQMVERAVEYLRVRGQQANGAFTGEVGIGPTGLVAASLLAVGVSAEDPMVRSALEHLLKNVREDGGIYSDQSLHRSYETCIALMALERANANGRHTEVMAKAEKFIRGIQWDESEGIDGSDMAYGGAGYGSQSRPDLSNTSFLVDTLQSLGNGPEDEAIQKALIFISRCQNLESPHNTTQFAAKINDGGFYYTIAGGGETKVAEPDPNGGLRSYGSMTYAGLKSMIYAGLDESDPRVKAAVGFLQKHYDLESNPGVGQQGLFYYYHTMAKALTALGNDTFVDAEGTPHDWQAQLRHKLAELQQPDGSWLNKTTRWMEGDPNLVSAYALLTLALCKPE
jgi:squalene-hopene/tetraprenyl-beta-curcumene cyclase